jgi:hypothetical protein
MMYNWTADCCDEVRLDVALLLAVKGVVLSGTAETGRRATVKCGG